MIPARFLLAGVVFAVLATANAAGYRYGVSDQAFYIPVVARALDPTAFPRDGALIDAQGQLMLSDEVLARLVQATGLSLELLFFLAYLLSLVLIWTALALIGSRIYRTPWLTVGLAAAFTLRHRIPRTSANSFEPYYHPRMLAFGLGALALAAVLSRRSWLAVALVAVSAAVHITTGLWWAVLIGTALAVLDARWRRLVLGGAIAAATIGAWAVVAGPLQSRLVTMDGVWLRAVAVKDSLFATEWPVWAWAANLALLAVLWWAHRRRAAHGLARPEDGALVWGATALVAVFLVTLPAVAAHQALVVQLQISRVFWLVDFVATLYVLSAVVETGRSPARLATAVVAVLLSISAVRGLYVMYVEHPERALVAIRLPVSPWDEAMAWLSRQPTDTHVLADPGHAWKYGTSVRVSAGRDVFLEEAKDSALAIYSRAVAVRVVERTGAVGDFGALSADGALDLARRYDLHYLVTEATLALPVVYENPRFHIYRLATAPTR